MRRFGFFALAVCFAMAGEGGAGGTPPAGGEPPAGAPPAGAPPAGAPPAGAPPAGAPPAGAPPAGAPPASPLLNPPQPAPSAFPLTNIADPLQQQLMRDKGWVTPEGNVNVGELTNGYFHANRLISGDAPSILRVPDAQTGTAEDWDGVYKALGRPDKAEDYQVNWGENANEKMVAFSQGFLHELGVPQNRIQGAVDKWNTFVAEMTSEQTAAQEAQNAADMEALQTSLGADYNNHIANGQKAVRALGISDETLDKAAGSLGLAAVAEIFAAVGKAMPAEAGMPAGQGGGSGDPAAMTPQMAQQEIDRLNADADFLKQYNGAMEPGHREAVDRMNRLYAKVAEGRKV